MLTEEAHHMFVGETGVARVVQRTCQAMRDAGIEDPYDVARIRALGVIDLPTIQRKANLHFSLTLDLFGSEVSTNAANAFNSGVKGRYREDKLDDDHTLESATYPVLRPVDGEVRATDVPALSALNMRLRDDYVKDCQKGIDRWNRVIHAFKIPFEIRLPHVAFNRKIGEFRSALYDLAGRPLTAEQWKAQETEMVPSGDDQDFIEDLMKTPEMEPGKFASWIASPRVGIDNQPGDFEYVKLA
jgi:benzoyl-CoA 2,3-dioxygenase component B